MPEQPESKRRPIDAPCKREQAPVPYAELHCKTNFSFLEGASHPDELVCRAAELGYFALAITDRNSLAGVVRAHIAAKQLGLKLLVGAELTPIDVLPVVLLATDRKSYGRLSRLITQGRRNAPKGKCHLTFDDIAAHSEGLLALALPENKESGVRSQGSKSPAHPLTCSPAQDQLTTDHRPLTAYHEVFTNRTYLLAELHQGPNDEQRLEQLLQLSKQSRVP